MNTFALISRVRLESYGSTASVCSEVLHDHAEGIQNLLGVPTSQGQEVIERQLDEPIDSIFAYKGRLILHPDISVPQSIQKD